VPPSGAGPGSHRDEVAERRDIVLESGCSPAFDSCVAWASVLRSVREIARSSSSSSGIGHAARPSGSSTEGERLDSGFSPASYECGLGDAIFSTCGHMFAAKKMHEAKAFVEIDSIDVIRCRMRRPPFDNVGNTCSSARSDRI